MNVIITGASRGIGYALAKKFSEKKRIKLYIISRSKERLKMLRKECLEINPDAKIYDISVDLTKLKGHMLPDYIDEEHIDILINNAGILIKKPFIKLSDNDMMNMIKVNFLVPVKLISGLSSKFGGSIPTHIVNIGSMGGFQGSVKFSGLSIYCATKAALASFTECLAVEFTGKNTFCNYLALGSVQTEMFAEAFPGIKASISAVEIADYILDFSVNGYKYYNGKIIPVSVSTP